MSDTYTTPTHEPLAGNARDLEAEFQWLRTMIDVRIHLYFGQDCAYRHIDDVPAPDLLDSRSPYARFLARYAVSRAERICLILALAPHVAPWVLDPFLIRNDSLQRGFTEFGGLRGTYHGGFLPTGETLSFLLAADDLAARFAVEQLFDPDHLFHRLRILRLDKDKPDEPLLSGALVLSKEYLTYFTSGKAYTPAFSNEFPAQRIQTDLGWDDLVLEDELLEELHEITAWLQHQPVILDDWKLRKHLQPGYRALFYGPPGTGKTLAAALLGKSTGLPTYRVDISKVVSKYIGETEKNLANIFDQAENQRWILFFDEADALFGKRTQTKDAKDRYANQETAFLLQRIEEYPGLVILASNLKTNLDEAFSRRFHSMIFFPVPRPELRLKLWQNVFAHFAVEPGLDLWTIAQAYELPGGSINNVLRSCAIRMAERGDPTVRQSDLLAGIRKELRKEGKTL